MKKKKIIIVSAMAAVLAVAGLAGSHFILRHEKSQEEIASDISEANEKADTNSKKAQQMVSQVSYTKSGNVQAASDGKCLITLKGDKVEIEGSGAVYEDGVLSFTKAGVYEISGELDDGRIEVNASKDDMVQIILNGVGVSCSDYAPFVVWQADEVIITLADETTNTFSDGGSYYEADSDGSTTQNSDVTTDKQTDSQETPSAAIFSKDDITFTGNGALIVHASCNDGITGKDTVSFQSGMYEIMANDDGIIGKDSLVIQDGSFVIEAEGDAMKATKEEDDEKGFISISGGTFDITCENDGIQAVTYVWIDGGEFSMETGGGAGATEADTDRMDRRGYGSYTESNDAGSCKGLKAGVDITVNGGNFTMDCADDAIHSNDTVSIKEGTFSIKTGDDGIHGDTAVVVTGGEVTIEQSYEGVEGETIVIKGGNLSVTASDDGLNAANGESAEGMDGPWGGGMTAEGSSSTGSLCIEGGTIYINAGGDGLDANGSISMSGGEVLIDGPTNDGNGTLDYDNEFIITGGTLAGAGSSGMMQGTSSNSTQGGMAVTLGNSYAGGSEVVITDSDGNEILSYVPSKTFSAIVVSCGELELGETYTITVDGTETGSVELSSVSVSNGSGGMGGGQMGVGPGNEQMGGNPGDGMGGRGGQRMR